MGLANIIKIAIVGEEAGLKEAVKAASADMDRLSKKAETGLGKATNVSKKALAVIGAGGLAIAGIALKNGDALNESQDQLANALANTGESYAKLTPQIKAVQKTSEGLGFTNKETNDALTAGTVASGHFGSALGLLGVAQDLARKKHIDLASAEILVVKASQGQTKGLKQLGIDLPVAATNAAKMAKANVALVTATQKYNVTLGAVRAGLLKGPAAEKALASAKAGVTKAQDAVNASQKAGGLIVAALAQRISGTAVTATQSLQGKTEILKAKFTDLTAHLGQKLIPIVLTVGTDFGKFTDWLTGNHAAMVAVVTVVGLVLSGMLALVVIEKVTQFVKAMQAAWAVLNAVMDANPLVLVAAGIVALGLVVFAAYKKFGPFRTAVDDVWQALQTGFHWVQTNWPLLLAILTGPIGIAVLVIHNHWSDITNGFHNVVSGISNGVDSIVGFITGLPGRVLGAAVGFGKAILSGILNGLGSAAGAVGSFVDSIARGLKNVINSTIIDPLRNFHFTISALGFSHTFQPFGSIPRLHSGGEFMSQGGRGEGLALLRDHETVRTPEQEAALNRRGGDTIINLPAGIDPTGVIRAQRRYERRNGKAA